MLSKKVQQSSENTTKRGILHMPTQEIHIQSHTWYYKVLHTTCVLHHNTSPKGKYTACVQKSHEVDKSPVSQNGESGTREV